MTQHHLTPSAKCRPRSLDLFCGIGGITLGLQRAGIETIGGIDCWAEAKQTFDFNHAPVRCLLSDLRETTVEEVEAFFATPRQQVDIIAGGPPCQGFSTLGKRNRSDPRNQLWTNFLHLVGQIRPCYVIIENVEGMVVADKGAVRDSIIKGFAEIGYRMKAKVFRVADYGVPQLRKRVIFFGWLQGLAEPFFPKPTSTTHVTVADAINDLPQLGSGQYKEGYEVSPLTPYQEIRRKGSTRLANHEAANHPAGMVEVLKHIPDGGNRKSIPDDIQPKSGFHNSYARLASWKPAIAVTSNMRKPSSARATHPTQNRGLTVREGLRLQSFDDSFVVLGPRTSQYLQVGNAVPPLFAAAIGNSVVSAFHANTEDERNQARKHVRSVKNWDETNLQLCLEMSLGLIERSNTVVGD